MLLVAGCGQQSHAADPPSSSAPAPASSAAAAPAQVSNWGCHGVDPQPAPDRPEPPAAKEGAPASTGDGGGVYGDPEAATRYWQQQTQSDCGLMATRLVIAEITGQPPTEGQLIDLAGRTPSECSPGEPVYDASFDPSDGGIGHGTCTTDLLLLLDHFGIDAQYTNDDVATQGGLKTGLDALEDYLGDGRQAIVCVNSHTIWDDDGDRSRCGHLVTVAAVDTGEDLVYLGDSGGEDTRGEAVSTDVFETAWATGGHELVVAGK